jgi:hypothetical protein
MSYHLKLKTMRFARQFETITWLQEKKDFPNKILHPEDF